MTHLQADDHLAGGGPGSSTAPEAAASEPTDLLTVDLPQHRGTLADLVQRVQRGEVDLADLPLAEITAKARRRLDTATAVPDPRQVAEFLDLASRLLALKAQRLFPDGPLESAGAAEAPGTETVDDPGARLAEYRLFKAAVDALLAPAADQGVRSFLGLVAPEVAVSEQLAIAPERLAQAFRAVLERLPAAEPLTVATTTFSVEEKVGWLRSLVEERERLAFEVVFAEASSRLEAVAIFLALLELVRGGSVRVDQDGPLGRITVSLRARG